MGMVIEFYTGFPQKAPCFDNYKRSQTVSGREKKQLLETLIAARCRSHKALTFKSG